MNNRQRKILVYYLYITDDFFERITNLANIECLRRYAHVFDEARIFLSTDDVNNLELITKIEHLFIDMGFNGNIKFTIHQNDEYRESRIVKEEIADCLKSYGEDLVFFAHGKGFSNLDTGYEKKSMLHWVIGCYYLSLEFSEEATGLITGMNTFSAYGSFPLIMQGEKKMPGDYLAKDEQYLGRIKYHWCYSGTFFWLNPAKLSDHMNIFGVETPSIFDRYYSEKYLGNVMSYESNACGHNLIYLWHHNNMYNDGVAESCARFILRDDESIRKYYEFYDSILKDINEKYGLN